jgi:hypothetical protein
MFAAPNGGTGGYVTTPLDPADYYDDENGVEITTRSDEDPVGPQCTLIHPFWAVPFEGQSNPQDRWLVVDSGVYGVDAIDPGCFDMGGDPTDPSFPWDDGLTNPETNAVETYLGLPNDTFTPGVDSRRTVWEYMVGLGYRIEVGGVVIKPPRLPGNRIHPGN